MEDIYTDVTVELDGGEIVCRPDPVQLYYAYEKGPNAVRWVKGESLGPGMRIEIGPWDPENPFGSVSTGPSGDARASANRGIRGRFKYGVTIRQGDAVVATVDPGVVNDPEPGGP
ncbi:MAG: hypothetical protein D6739_08685 [Nitrospirae bacterium]|nr:MAG: hypothetical protein D6739_08685 [Nitrospirota bacterium]